MVVPTHLKTSTSFVRIYGSTINISLLCLIQWMFMLGCLDRLSNADWIGKVSWAPILERTAKGEDVGSARVYGLVAHRRDSIKSYLMNDELPYERWKIMLSEVVNTCWLSPHLSWSIILSHQWRLIITHPYFFSNWLHPSMMRRQIWRNIWRHWGPLLSVMRLHI